jgi:hypothetical protein
MLFLADFPLSPGDLHKGGQKESWSGVGGDSEVPYLEQEFGIVDLELCAQRYRNLIEFGFLTELLEEMLILLAEIGFLHRFLTVAENAFLHWLASL